MLLTRQIKPEDRDRIRALTGKYGMDYSSHAFQSLFLWRRGMNLTAAIQDDLLAVKCGCRGDNAWFFPVGAEKSVAGFLDGLLETPGASLCYVGEREAEYLDRNRSGCFSVERDGNSDEYICDVEAHVKLESSEYKNLRRHYHHLLRTCVTHEEMICGSNMQDVRSVLEKWEIANTAKLSGALVTDGIDEEALDNFAALDMCGIICYFDGVPAGVAYGFPLSDDTFDFFCCKECSGLSGFSYYVQHALLERLQGQYRYWNVEEDLGIEGLRAMKTRLHPVRKNTMYIAVGRTG